MRDDLDEVLNEQTSVTTAAIPASAPQKPSTPRRPFTAADRVRIENLARSGMPANEIAKRIGRGSSHPQVARLVRQLGLAKPGPGLVALQLTLRPRTWEALEAAARRRDMKPAALAVELIDHIIRRGSVDQVRHDG